MNGRTPARAALLALSFVIAALLTPAGASATHFANPGTTSNCNPAPSTDCTLNVQLGGGRSYNNTTISVTLDPGYTFAQTPAIGATDCAITPTVTLQSPTVALVYFAGISPACTFGLVEQLAYTGTPTTLPCQTFDTAGNSPPYRICATADTVAPPAPSITSDPTSPDPSTTPSIRGAAEPFSMVTLYASGDCSGTAAATSSAAAYGSPGFPVAVAADTSATFSTTATDAAGNVSPCSSSFTYTSDTIAPAEPTLDAISPADPANTRTLFITGTAEADSTVRLFATADCSGPSLISGTSGAYATPGLSFTLASDGTYTYHATSTDAAGNTSSCSTDSITHSVDTTAPAEPTLDAISPADPANTRTLFITGTAEADSTVRLFATADCSGPSLISGTSGAYATPGLSFTLASDGTYTYHATSTDAAGNTSSCSTDSITHSVDTTAPAEPTLDAISPADPANTRTLFITGTAEADSTVRLFATADCSGPSLISGTSGAYATPGLSFTLASDGTYTYHATSTDAAGNTSSCSTDSITHSVDTTAPQKPVITASTPGSPADAAKPEFKGAAEAGSTVRLYLSGDCTGPIAASGSDPDFADEGLTVTVASDATSQLSATATDALGNASACSDAFSYTEDSTTPVEPTLTGFAPTSPSNSNTPRILGTAEPGSTVRLYTSASCSGAPEAVGSVAAFSSSGLLASVGSDQVTPFYATTTDQVGHTSACSSGLAYQEDSTGPAAPSFDGTTPVSPSGDSTPRVRGTADAGTTVRLYASADCRGASIATGTPAEFADPGLTVTLASDSESRISASSTDAAGNVTCSTGTVTYVEDSTAPAAPAIAGFDPASPANDNRPKLKGSGEAGGTVRIYASADCTGAIVATGTATSFAAGLALAVTDDTTTQFSATVTDATGNVSPCSAAASYVEDSSAPVAPSLSSTTPASPAEDHHPAINGSAEAGSTVRIYALASCAGAITASGSAATLAGAGFEVVVAHDSQTTYTAIAIDAAGNSSPCSDPIRYTETTTPRTVPVVRALDRIAPRSTIGALTRTQSRTRKITLRGTADGTGSAVKLVRISVARAVGSKCRFLTVTSTFTAARSCARTTYLDAKATNAWTIKLPKLPEGSYKVRSRAIDAAGNVERKDASRNLLRFRL